MIRVLRQLLAPSGLWPLAAVLAVGIIVVAALAAPVAVPPKAVDNPLVYSDGAPVPNGRWSALCIDGAAYLEIVSPHGQAVVPKRRRNGLVERCAPLEGE
jgi:murein endopeptidase